jgi:hypothetical protein
MNFQSSEVVLMSMVVRVRVGGQGADFISLGIDARELRNGARTTICQSWYISPQHLVLCV